MTFTGQVPDGTVHMQLMDVMANASDHEPFGIVLLEAMSLGVPVVAVAAGGPAEIIDTASPACSSRARRPSSSQTRSSGSLTEPGLRSSLEAGGRRAVEERFTTKRMVEQITESIERLAADAGSARRAA